MSRWYFLYRMWALLKEKKKKSSGRSEFWEWIKLMIIFLHDNYFIGSWNMMKTVSICVKVYEHDYHHHLPHHHHEISSKIFKIMDRVSWWTIQVKKRDNYLIFKQSTSNCNIQLDPLRFRSFSISMGIIILSELFLNLDSISELINCPNHHLLQFHGGNCDYDW